MLLGQEIIGFRLIVPVVFHPSDLEHSLESKDAHVILLLLLIELSELLVHEDGLLVVVSVFD